MSATTKHGAAFVFTGRIALAQLWRFNPRLVAWGLSATLGNLQQAMEVLCHPGLDPASTLARGTVPTWQGSKARGRARLFRLSRPAQEHPAAREVLSQELEISRLRATLGRLARKTLVMAELRHPSPMSLPLMVERFREQLTTEQANRLDRILKEMEEDAASA